MRLVVILSLVSCLMGCNASVSGSLGDLDVSFRDAPSAPRPSWASLWLDS